MNAIRPLIRMPSLGLRAIVAWCMFVSPQAQAEAPADGKAKAQDAEKAEAPAEGIVPRVFIAQLNAGEGASKGEASLLNDAMLVSARRYETKFEIRTSQDIEGMLQLEAAQILTGCDVVSCAAEIGDALGADQLITGQLGHVGNTWLLSLTRTERSTLKALSRTQVRAKGAAPDVLFPLIDAQVAEVFGVPPADVITTPPPPPQGSSIDFGFPLLVGGSAMAAAGLSLIAVSGVTLATSYWQFNIASNPKDKLEFDTAVLVGKFANVFTVVLSVSGAPLVLAGVGLLASSFLFAGEE